MGDVGTETAADVQRQFLTIAEQVGWGVSLKNEHRTFGTEAKYKSKVCYIFTNLFYTSLFDCIKQQEWYQDERLHFHEKSKESGIVVLREG